MAELKEGQGPNAILSTQISSIMTRLQRYNGIRTNEESHQRFWPADTFFQNVPGLLHKRILWPK